MKAKYYSDRGLALLKEGRYDDSLAAYAKAIAADPESARVYRWRGEVYKEIGEFDLAIADFRKGIELSAKKNTAEAEAIKTAPQLCERGELSGEIGDYAGAMQCFSAAIALDGVCVRAWLGRAFTRCKMGEYDAAIADYGRLLEFAPRNARAYAGRGNAYRDKGDLPAALADYASALRLSPGYSLAYYDMGNAYAAAGKSAEAAENFRKYLALQPSKNSYMVPWAYYSLACLEALAGRGKSALELLEKALAAGLNDKEYIDSDRDLAPLRGDPAFAKLMSKYFPEK